MKQTHSALTMLLKAYRAIFKSAYVKGMASAVVLTAGLAAGAANADAFSGDTINVDESAIVNGTGSSVEGYDKSYTEINIGNNETGTVNGELVIVSGAASADGNYVSGASTGVATLTGSGSLVININNDEEDHGLLIGQSGALSVNTVEVRTGVLKVSGGTTQTAA